MAQFGGKVALVTGATSGIGRDTASAFAREGARVVAVGRNEERGAETVRMIGEAGGEVAFVRADISKAVEVKAMVARALELYGRLDYAVNNAGLEQTSTAITETADEEMERIVDNNLKDTWLSLKYELPALREHEGAIVNISSFWGVVGMIGGSSYAATKGGIIALTRAIAAEEGASGIRVNCISPGAIQTGMLDRVVEAAEQLDIQQWAKEKTVVGRVAEAREIADAAVFLCSDRAGYITGHNLMLDGGYTII